MSNWIFLEELQGTKVSVEQAVNLDSVAFISPHIKTAELVFYFSKAQQDPHIVGFTSSELCQAAYDNLKSALQNLG